MLPDPLALGRVDWNFKQVIFKSVLVTDAEVLFVQLPSNDCHRPNWWKMKIGCGNELVPSGNQAI